MFVHIWDLDQNAFIKRIEDLCIHIVCKHTDEEMHAEVYIKSDENVFIYSWDNVIETKDVYYNGDSNKFNKIVKR